jgi:hypothetical protein
MPPLWGDLLISGKEVEEEDNEFVTGCGLYIYVPSSSSSSQQYLQKLLFSRKDEFFPFPL